MYDISQFEKDKAYGAVGEQFVIDYLRGQGCQVIDITENKRYQKRDVDILVDGIETEIKRPRCFQEENKICLELFKIKTGGAGWLYYTTAKYIIWVDTLHKRICKVNTVKLRSFFAENKDKYKIENKGGYQIVFIPVSDLGKIAEVTEIEQR